MLNRENHQGKAGNSLTQLLSLQQNIINYFNDIDLILLLCLSKSSRENFSSLLATIFDIPWHHYSALSESSNPTAEITYAGVRDYLAINYLKKLTTKPFNLETVADIAKTLTLKKLLSTPGTLPITDKPTPEWETIYTNARQRNTDYLLESKKQVKQMLIKCGERNPRKAITKLTNYITNKTSVVFTFKFSLLTKDEQRLLNYFQLLKNGMKKFGPQETDRYTDERIISELFNLSDMTASAIQKILLNPSVCYATLQDSETVEAITEFGNNFIVFNAAIKKMATIIFGGSLSNIRYHRPHKKPISLTGSLIPLLAQFSEETMKAYLSKINYGYFPANYTKQVLGGQPENILEVHIPANISLLDPAIVTHIHLEEEQLANSIKLSKLNPSIGVSFGTNPFNSTQFAKAFAESRMDIYQKETIINYIQEFACILAESSRRYLKVKYTQEALIFNLKITKNSYHLHQAQAALILFLLGVRKYFETTSAINLPETNIRYVLPLNNTSKQAGGLDDHDAYTNEVQSLKNILHRFIKRAFLIGAISKLNEEPYLGHDHPYSFFAKGAVEEILQTTELKLTPPGINGDISFKSFCERIIFEANEISPTNPAEYKVMECKLIPEDMDGIIQRFKREWICYKTVIITDSDAEPGNIYMAYRHNAGFATEGGKHLNPLSDLCALDDLEFMRSRRPKAELQKFFKKIGESSKPRTAYYTLPSAMTDDKEIDTFEFATGSLKSYSIHKLAKLNDNEINEVTEFFKLSSEEFRKIFNTCLPLAPYQFIEVYLEHCEKELALYFSTQSAYNLEEKDEVKEKYNPIVKVIINKETDRICFNKHTYKVAKPNFCETSISCNNETVFLKIYKILVTCYPSQIQLVTNKDKKSILAENINPLQLIISKCNVDEVLRLFNVFLPLVDNIKQGVQVSVPDFIKCLSELGSKVPNFPLSTYLDLARIKHIVEKNATEPVSYLKLYSLFKEANIATRSSLPEVTAIPKMG